MTSDYTQIRLSQLRIGVKLRAPIYDGRPGRNQLLLAEGAQLTTGQLELLTRRGITQVLVHNGDLAEATGRTAATASPGKPAAPAVKAASAPGASGGALPGTWKQNRKSFSQQIQRPQTLHRDPAVLGRIEKTYHAALSTTKSVFEEFSHDHKINSSVVTCVAEQQLEQACQDLDLYISVGLQPVSEGYPSRHSVQTSMLAVSIGTIMGLSREELIELSSGCLLHDAGMMLVPQHIVEHEGPLSSADRLEVLKHPLHIANALNGRNDISHAVKATAYQIHERMNGTGYPRKRQHPQIHLFARIGAVADTYLAMISPRNGRTGLSAYDAVEKLLYATRIGLFDPTVVRALLHAASLFPVGSMVTLNDGRTGRVTRSNQDRYDRPVVEIVTGNSGNRLEIIDLAEHGSLNVVSAGGLVAV